MNAPWLAANLDDPSAVERLAAAIRSWDPAFDLYRPPADALLYEPDGTLYAIAVQTPMTAECRHRVRAVRPGDLLIVPRELAVGIEPTVDLLGLRFEGDPPDHFRERFIQVWGFDHLPAVDQGATVADADSRFPLSYSVRRFEKSSETLPRHPAHVRRLMIGFEGRLTIESVDGRRSAIELAPRAVVLVEDDEPLLVGGTGRLGVLVIEPEIVFSARRAAVRREGRGATPEYSPPPPQPAEPGPSRAGSPIDDSA